MANQIQNEQAKLRATLCNGMALSVFTVGVVVPMVSTLYQWFRSADEPGTEVETTELMVIWLVVAGFLHLLATLCLEGIAEND